MSVRMLTALGAGGGGAGGGDSEGGKAKEAAEQQRKKPKKKIVLNYEQYQRTANMLVLLLRRANKEEGMKQIELIQAYLADREADGEIQNEEELIQQTGLLRSVIQRLINRDHVLFVVQVRNNIRHKQAGKQTHHRSLHTNTHIDSTAAYRGAGGGHCRPAGAGGECELRPRGPDLGLPQGELSAGGPRAAPADQSVFL